MSARTYRRKPYNVQAIQWDGSNVAEVTAFTDGDFEEEHGSLHGRTTTGYLFTGESYEKRGEYLHTGDWIIRAAAGGICQVVSAGFFREAYELAEDTTETEKL